MSSTHDPSTAADRRPSHEPPTETGAIPLERVLKPHWVFAIALGSAVGWGAFILPTDWLAGGGTMGALLGFVIGTSLISLIAVSYGLMIELLPVTGGAFAYALKVLGRIPAFGVGWFLALAYACLVALNASAFTLVLRMLAPGIMEAIPMYSVAGEEIFLPSVIAGIVVLLLTGWLNQRGTAVSGKFQFIACVIMAVAVLLVVIAALVT